MKKVPLLINFVFFIALCASMTFWALRFFKPQSRALAAPAIDVNFEPSIGQWGALFGRSAVATAAASNYALKGVVVARRPEDSAAILIADGKGQQTVAIGRELSPGVKLLEVHEDYIVISEAGLIKRVELPAPTPINQGVQTYTPPLPPTVLSPAENPAGTVVTPRPQFTQPAIVSPTGFPVPPQRQ
jgi:general secretion pathway protein C